ncbi:MAG TPA: metallophosphoesterase [Armatimonadota bacterium]|nr:metallophosphoesterase [Armatimonadota bacterium]HOJ20668.1 metallophosphoesterase [Armatimonadota bacterium]HOM81920.1 metallophosphoesterase [Armatimonadota bacterium]HOQ27223.1 metallophosphoesterase [Armatimonadota bacterium]HPO72895.1 metallophosphoesterase [Armatimonadota bacterium]
MKVGIVSDTHDHLENLAEAIRLLNARGVELVLHLGDWVAPFVPVFMTKTAPEPLRCPVKGIFGNNDGDHFLFLQVIAREQTGIEIRKTLLPLELDGRRIVCYHGTEPEITEALVASKRWDVVFAGHTHEAGTREVDGVLHVNPGSLSGIRGGKPGGPATFALYDTATGEAEIITLGE